MTPFALARVQGAEPALAVVVGGRARPLAELWPAGPAPRTVAELLVDWDRHLDLVSAALDADPDRAEWTAMDDLDVLPPVDPIASLYCCGANYYDHAEEMGVPRPDKSTSTPFHFLLPVAALQGHRGNVVRPAGVTRLDWEVELAAVIGRRAHRVPAERALEHVAAYTVANDVSCRDPDRMRSPIFGANWLWSKGQATLQPLGPTLVPARFVPDPGAVALRLTVDGIVRQNSSTAQMIFSLEEQIEHLSSMVPLLPGDVIVTGTPAGTAAAHDAYLQDGQVMVAEVEGVGRLENRVVGSAGA
ncbi:fumarylacetoacetate hydrolase family protein [Modestobacter lapidis]|nr:fumarylacetoacetate hydrolase family protein [Modestobacter lapidis]